MKTADRRQELREKLLEAAERTISRRGLAALRARDLAKEVGCALGAIYNVFPDLDSLIFEVNSRTLTAIERHFQKLVAANDERSPSRAAAIANLDRLAYGYLEFAAKNQLRWRALFDHRMEEGHKIPKWYRDRQRILFSLVETPLSTLRPELNDEERATFARTMFAAIHGVVSLGLDQKLMPLPLAVLRQQLSEIFDTLGAGLAPQKTPRSPGKQAGP